MHNLQYGKSRFADAQSVVKPQLSPRFLPVYFCFSLSPIVLFSISEIFFDEDYFWGISPLPIIAGKAQKETERVSGDNALKIKSTHSHYH